MSERRPQSNAELSEFAKTFVLQQLSAELTADFLKRRYINASFYFRLFRSERTDNIDTYLIVLSPAALAQM
jgi:hypothetical protein